MDFRQANLSDEDLRRIHEDKAYQVGDVILLYVQPIFMLIGLVGNSLALAVMLKKKNRKISSCTYLAALSVIDNTTLLFFTGHWVAHSFFRVEDFMNVYTCRTFTFSSNFLYLTQVLVIMAMTVDRFVAVRYPLKAVILCTVRRARITILALLSGILLFCLPYLTVEHIGGATCAFSPGSNKVFRILAYVFVICAAILGTIFPFALMLAFNCSIMCAIRKREKYITGAVGVAETENSGRNVKTTHNGNDSDNKGKATEATQRTTGTAVAQNISNPRSYSRQITIMMLLVSFSLLIFTLPKYLETFVYSFLVTVAKSPSEYANYYMTTKVSNLSVVINSSVNFFLYCLGGSNFRNQVGQMLRLSTKKQDGILMRRTTVSLRVRSSSHV